jgi:hypothetical protein
MSHKIIALGGTGQMVLHYYLLLYLLGEIRKPFDAVVVDTDDTIQSLSTIGQFLKDLRYGVQPRDGLGVEIPVVATIKAKPGSFTSAFHALSGEQNKNYSEEAPHPAQAFYDAKSLSQDLMKGLYARPALSSVIAQDDLMNASLIPTGNTKLVVTGSIIGGTGGGLIAPVVDFIQRRITDRMIPGTQRCAVLFGEYFVPSPDKIQDDVYRFKSNQMLVLRSLQEALAKVRSFHIVGGPGQVAPIERDPNREKKGQNIPWPKDDGDPYWQGVQAVEYLLNESAAEMQVDFAEKEVTTPRMMVSLEQAQQTWRIRLQLVETMLGKRVISRMSDEPFVGFVWGRGLTRLILHFWGIAAEREGGKERVKDFPDRIEEKLRLIWTDKDKGLREAFPSLTEGQKVRPGSIKKIVWPSTEGKQRDPALFTSADRIAHIAAATILFMVLQKGK